MEKSFAAFMYYLLYRETYVICNCLPGILVQVKIKEELIYNEYK